MMNGITTMTTQPIISTEYHTVLLPVFIWLGGMKLKTNAKSEPPKPTNPMIHIRRLPLPRRKGRGADFILYLNTMAAANISMYIIR